ncbi:hypothetical protein [Salinibacillus xinjiangensis]|uniref:Uncharacterized protein n=1 Tax=Salinibacillus xinjiangensis TaxID=1229268 RepID=A0A6G1X9Z3_9BACI|nr:hypothetical protein [Salinibacillus xinjiangensis]MRG87762.1 hypothetical protein [Salinibacillus xinjiangensis]
MSWYYVAMFEAYYSAFELAHSTKPFPFNMIPFATAVMIGDLGLIMSNLNIGLINIGLLFSIFGVLIGLFIRKIMIWFM